MNSRILCGSAGRGYRVGVAGGSVRTGRHGSLRCRGTGRICVRLDGDTASAAGHAGQPAGYAADVSAKGRIVMTGHLACALPLSRAAYSPGEAVGASLRSRALILPILLSSASAAARWT